jgi:hypothetical protein
MAMFMLAPGNYEDWKLFSPPPASPSDTKVDRRPAKRRRPRV